MYENSAELETDAVPQNSVPNHYRNNINRIHDINELDLDYVERHLDFYEKTSIVFLLAGDNIHRSRYFVQHLMVLSANPIGHSDILKKWSRECQHEDPNKWRNQFVEALCIIQAKKLISQLNLNVHDLYMTYLPQIRDRGLFIHRISKILYYLCEQLTKKETLHLINHISSKYSDIGVFDFPAHNGPYLEVYILHWIVKGVIDMGEEKPENMRYGNGRTCNLKPILEFLKQQGKDMLKDKIQTAVDSFNQTSSSNITDKSRATAPHYNNIGFHEQLPNLDFLSHDKYVIRKERAGILLIVNQVEFYRDTNPDLEEFLSKYTLECRRGTNKDKIALNDTFSYYGYKIVIRENLTHNEMMASVQEVVDQGLHYDSVVVCLLSHGNRGVVYGANSVAVRIQSIQDILTSRRLLDKPKILIVQACQGDETLRAVEAEPELAHDGPSPRSSPIYSDILVCVSAVPGFTSFRDTEKGSWFIQTLCKKLKDLSNEKHFLDILTVVSREVQNKRGAGDECMVPIFNSILRRDLFLPRRL